MISQDTILQLLTNYGVWLLFPLAIFEGPIVAVIAGYFIKQGAFTWQETLLVLTLADLVGDTLFYSLGRYGHSGLSIKWRENLGLSDERVGRMMVQFKKHGGKLVLFGKIAHVPGLPILVAAGISRMNYVKFLAYNLIGTIPKSILFMWIGFMLGSAFGQFENYLLDYTIIVVLVLAAGFLTWRFFHPKKAADPAPPPKS